jgi:IclR family acetate operon transcriptional repressor
MDEAGADMINSVKRALELLDFVVQQGLAGKDAHLHEAAKAAGIMPTTARNILKTMELCGYIARGEGNAYLPGPKCAGLRRVGAACEQLVTSANRPVVHLAESTGESVVLATIFGAEWHALLRAAGSSVVRVDASALNGQNFFTLSTARAMMAYMQPAEIDALVDCYGWPGEYWGGITDREALEAKLAELRKNGVAENSAHNGVVASLSMPILSRSGQPLAALGMHLPMFRYDETHRNELIAALREAVDKICAEIN